MRSPESSQKACATPCVHLLLSPRIFGQPCWEGPGFVPRTQSLAESLSKDRVMVCQRRGASMETRRKGLSLESVSRDRLRTTGQVSSHPTCFFSLTVDLEETSKVRVASTQLPLLPAGTLGGQRRGRVRRGRGVGTGPLRWESPQQRPRWPFSAGPRLSRPAPHLCLLHQGGGTRREQSPTPDTRLPASNAHCLVAVAAQKDSCRWSVPSPGEGGPAEAGPGNLLLSPWGLAGGLVLSLVRGLAGVGERPARVGRAVWRGRGKDQAARVGWSGCCPGRRGWRARRREAGEREEGPGLWSNSLLQQLDLGRVIGLL